MIDAVEKLKEELKVLKADEERTEDPAEKERIRYQMSCIGGTILELVNPHPRKNGYDGISPKWYRPSNKTVPVKKPSKK